MVKDIVLGDEVKTENGTAKISKIHKDSSSGFQNHFIDGESEILFEYFDQDDNKSKIFEYIENQNVIESMDSIKINIGSLIQKYVNNDYNYDGIKMTLSDENYNFNNLSIIYNENDTRYYPRLEIFYSE